MATPFATYKLIVLYMLDHVESTLTNSQISEFILEHDYTNYFSLQQTLSELVQAELIQMNTSGNISRYRISEEGHLTLSYLEKELSDEIKSEAMEYLRSSGYTEPEKILSPSDYYTAPHGKYNVRCQIIEKNNSLLELNLTVRNEEIAKEISKSWSKKYQRIYEILMEELL